MATSDVDEPVRLPGVVVQGPAGWQPLVDLFLAGKRGPTLTAYRTDLDQYTAWCDDAEVDPLRAGRAELARYVAELERLGRAPRTVSRKLSAIAGAYRTAMAEAVITRNPMEYLVRPTVPDESQALGLDRAELIALLEAARNAGPLEWALVSLLGLNGLRVSEICSADVAGLTRSQGHRVLRVLRKGAKDRRIALAPPAQTAIDAYLTGRRQGPLLQSPAGGRLSRYAARRIVERCAEAAGLPDHLTPHSLRHTYVTLCLEAGIPLQEVQDSADHADPRTTQGYNRARQVLDRAPTYILVDFLAGRIGPGGADPQGSLF